MTQQQQALDAIGREPQRLLEMVDRGMAAVDGVLGQALLGIPEQDRGPVGGGEARACGDGGRGNAQRAGEQGP